MHRVAHTFVALIVLSVSGCARYAAPHDPRDGAAGDTTAGLDSTAIADTDSLHADHDFTPGTWHYVVGTYEVGGATKRRIHFAGALVDERDVVLVSLDAETREVTIGAGNGSGEDFQGWIDEARISRVARSTTWINISFINQSRPAVGSGGIVASLGPEEVR